MRLTDRGWKLVWLLVWTGITLFNVFVLAQRPVEQVVQYIPCAP